MREIYEFKLGSEVFRYASSEVDISYGGHTFRAVPIERGDIVNEFENQNATLTLPTTLDPAPRFRVLNPSLPVWVTILKENGVKLFVGKVSSCSFKDEKATLKLISLQGMMKTKIPSRTFGAACSFELFDKCCGLDKRVFQTTLYPSDVGISGVRIISDKLNIGNGYFAGGYVQSANEFSYILSHLGNVITLLYPLQSFDGASSLFVYPGCDKTRATCGTKFKNEVSYGGFAFVPNKNPVTEGF